MEDFHNGRPTDYKKEYDKIAYKLTLVGFTDEQLAATFDVTFQTINNWKHAHPSFFESIKKGKGAADGEVVASLYKRARGYSYTETTKEVVIDKETGESSMHITKQVTKDIAPDTGAAMAWLKNRQPRYWRDKHEIEVDDTKINKSIVQLADLINNPVPNRTIEDEEKE